MKQNYLTKPVTAGQRSIDSFRCSLQRLKKCALPFLFIALTVSSLNALAQHHPDDAAKEAEHHAMLNLVPVASATHKAIADGSWSSTNTWGGTIPGAGSKVHIPVGVTVTVDREFTARHFTIRVDGILKFAPGVNTRLIVETMVIDKTGELEIGTSASPIQTGRTARITIADNGDINTTYDPTLLSRGLICHGKARIFGEWKTQFLKTSHYLPQGTTSITLATTPVNWKVGDRIVVGAIRERKHGDVSETFTITAISGNRITLNAPISVKKVIEDTNPLFAGLYPYVANLSRNVVIESENPGVIHRRGHVMFMHNQNADIQNALFKELGRTNKAIEFTKVVSSSTSNVPGRYACHLHRCGDTNITGISAFVKGCAVEGSPGWGYVNHESYANFEENVSYNVFGSHFVGENGSEIGGFYKNIAIYSKGTPLSTGEKERELGDHGHSGVGFWMTSGSIKVNDNVSMDNGNAGYAYITRKTPAETHDFFAKNWDDPAVFAGLDYFGTTRIPIHSFKRNISYAERGIHIIDVELNGTLNSENVFEDFLSLNAEGPYGLDIEYSRNIRLKNVRVLRERQLYTDIYNGGYALKLRATWDHLFPFDVKTWSYMNNVTFYGYHSGIDNGPDVTVNDSKVYVIDNSLKTTLASTNVVLDPRPSKLKYITSAQVLPRPTFSVAPGFYTTAKSVTISSVPGATVYYKTLQTADDWKIYDCCFLSTNLYMTLTPGNLYTGQTISTSGAKWTVIVAYAKKDNVISPTMIGFFKNDPSAGGDLQAPTAPTNLVASNITSTGFNLSWTASTDNVGVTGYDIYRGTTLAGSSTTTSFNVTGLAPATTYSMTVRAKDAAANVSTASTALSVRTATASPSSLYEAESATLSGPTVATNNAGYTGAGFADYGSTVGQYVQWSVSAAAAGTHTFEIRYANGGTTNRPLSISINGTTVNSALALNPTGGWATWSTVRFTANLNAGTNTVRATLTQTNGPNVDHLKVAAGTPTTMSIAGDDGMMALNESAADAQAVFSVYPNPATENVNVQFSAKKAQVVRYQLSNLAGQALLSGSQYVAAGSNSVSLDVSAVSEGVYLLNLEVDGKKSVKKVMIRK